MNRHHPYGGGYDGPPNRRGGHPGGPDRPHRWQDRGGGNHRGRGNRGRGDGNYGSGHNYYDGNYNNAYDQPPPQGDIYSSGSQENTFYQNDYGNGSSSSYSNGPNNYNQGFGDYEAERARERLQGSEISGRPIDVHYSLPRDDQKGDKEKNQQFQGMLQVTLRNSPSGQHIDDNELVTVLTRVMSNSMILGLAMMLSIDCVTKAFRTALWK
ncbi:hypothetical protein ONZ45_g10731 [Pleurotus djamor]|nr:hypothetical protein ONZ45_g10731 [Pleurotus djamor]